MPRVSLKRVVLGIMALVLFSITLLLVEARYVLTLGLDYIFSHTELLAKLLALCFIMCAYTFLGPLIAFPIMKRIGYTEEELQTIKSYFILINLVLTTVACGIITPKNVPI